MLKFGKIPKFCERKIAITKGNISVVLHSESNDDDMEYLTSTAFKILDKYKESKEYENNFG